MRKVLQLTEHVESGLGSFMQEIFSQKVVPQLGRPVEFDNDSTETIFEYNQCYIMEEMADILKISKSSAKNYFHHLSYANCFDFWVPHKLKKNKQKIFLIIFLHSVLY